MPEPESKPNEQVVTVLDLKAINDMFRGIDADIKVRIRELRGKKNLLKRFLNDPEDTSILGEIVHKWRGAKDARNV